MIEKRLSELVRSALTNVLAEKSNLLEQSERLLRIDAAKSVEHGDFTTNIALLITKSVGLPPMTIASKLCENMAGDPLLADISVAKPGFINFKVSDSAIFAEVQVALKLGAAFGRWPKRQADTVLIEFVSANPTGPLHLGHARGAFVGDALARLLDMAGYVVEREFYVNDTGKQVRTLGESIYLRYRQLFGEEVALAKDAYPGEYVIGIARQVREQDGDKWLHTDRDAAVSYLTEFGIKANLKDVADTLKAAGIRMDRWFSEASLQEQKVPGLLEIYRRAGVLYEADVAQGLEEKTRREDSNAAKFLERQLGGTFLKTSLFGDDEDRIVIRKSGELVYLISDLAYHKDKFDRGYKRMIALFGADHAGHVNRLRAGMRALGLDDKRLEFVVVQIMRLIRGGKEVRFSKRAGEIYRLSDLLEDIGADAARFIFLMRSPNAQFDFDLDLCLKQSQDNPVFYVQYAHARMAALLRRAAESNIEISALDSLPLATMARLKLKEERELLKGAIRLPEIIRVAAESCEPHRVLYYCNELIGDFHSYYSRYKHTERVISDDRELSQARLAMVAVLKTALANALQTLGVSAPEHMEVAKKDD
jgi:arginyl-tRNA synthetase